MAATPLPPVPLNDLRRHTTEMMSGTETAIKRVLRSGWYVLGPENEALEHELAAYVGAAQCITVGNGTDALQLALTAVGVRRDDLVITAANAGGYTSTAARLVGAIPWYADVDQSTLVLTPATLAAAVNAAPGRIGAVVVTHLYGKCAAMTDIMEWATTQGFAVIEDCAQSLGARHRGRKCGSFGAVATTSFYPTKNLGGCGDGGALFTSDSSLAARIRKLRQYGWSTKYHTELPGGMNSRMDELQAALLRERLPRLESWNDRRREIHRRYEAALGFTPTARWVHQADDSYVAHLAVLAADDRDEVIRKTAAAGIQTDIHYPIPDHHQPGFLSSEVKLPVTELMTQKVLSFPMFPGLTESEVDRVCSVLCDLTPSR